MKELFDRMVKENENKIVTITCKKTENMVINKHDNAMCELCTGDFKSWYQNSTLQ